MSVYLHDTNSLAAHLTIRAQTAALPLTHFGEFELTNAVRAAVVHRKITVPEAEHTLSLIRQDASISRLVRTSCDMDAVFGTASSLSHRHTYGGGYRALDVLHVASAVALGYTDFLTFDQRQALLARQAGLATHP